MTTCEMLDRHLEHYLAGQLPDADASALELHAAECGRCGPILEARSRLTQVLSSEVMPDPLVRTRTLERLALRTSVPHRRHWFVPVAIAAGLVLVFGLTRPPVKSGQRRPVDGLPAAMAAERADGEFQRLDAARAELRDALVRQPGDPMLLRALDRLDAQRKSLENLIREFES